MTTLFDLKPDAQSANLARVSEKLEKHVVIFFALRKPGDTFYVSQLTKYVADKEPCAPDSPARVARDLRRRGVIAYSVLNRRQSLYQVERV